MRSSGLAHDPDAAGDAFNQRIVGTEKSGLSAGLRALESSIRVSASDRAVMRGGIFRNLALVLFAAPLALGATFAWHTRGKETREMVSRWALSVDRCYRYQPGRSRPLRPLLLLSWCGMKLSPSISPREMARSSLLPSKSRGTRMSLRRRGFSRTTVRKRHRRSHIFGLN